MPRRFMMKVSKEYLERSMRRLLVGKQTIHGASPLAAALLARRQANRNVDVRAVTEAMAGAHQNLTPDELRAVRAELTLSNLNYKTLFYRMIRRRWRFYLAVVAFQLFAAVQVSRVAPSRPHDRQALADASTGVVSYAGFATRLGLPAPHGYGHVRTVPASKRTRLAYQLAWFYISPYTAYALDRPLRRALGETASNNTVSCWSAGWYNGDDEQQPPVIVTDGGAW